MEDTLQKIREILTGTASEAEIEIAEVLLESVRVEAEYREMVHKSAPPEQLLTGIKECEQLIFEAWERVTD